MALGSSLLLALVVASSALHMRVPLPCRRAAAPPRMQEAADDDGMAADDMAAAFRARLDEEGGATQFKLKTDAQRAASSVTGGAQSAVDAAGGAIDRLVNVGEDQPTSSDIRSWKLTLGFFALTLALAFGTAMRSSDPDPSYTPTYGRQSTVDTYTSDGQDLMFGRRI